MKMINLIYERNGIQYDFIQVKRAKRLHKWIEELRKLGPIKIIRIWSE